MDLSKTEHGPAAGLPLAPCSAIWDDPHFQLAAEHFGYVAGAQLAERDREVIALGDFLRSKLGEWTVRAADFDRLANAARALRAACKDRISPGHYAKLDDECRAIDAILSPNKKGQPRP